MRTLIQRLLVASTLFIEITASSQEARFFMPSEIKQAYENGTRSYDGKPGKNYWQNTADYKIAVTIDAKEKRISGQEEIIYHNNCKESLTSLVMRFYYDVYKKGNARAAALKPKDIGDGVEIIELKVDGKIIDTESSMSTRREGTNISFRLKEPLKQGNSVKIETTWKQKIPYTNRRTGVYDSTTFFIANWYPQMAVYDDIFGWDYLDYDIRTEFYNNLGNFDVKITVPKDYFIRATGTLQNYDKVLPTSIKEKYEKALVSDSVIKIIDAEDLKNGFQAQDSVWHFVAKEVSDFAFGISNHYQWSAVRQIVNNKNVLVSSVFPTEKEHSYTELTEVQQKTMKHFSENVPGVPYPYEAFTSFIGLNGGGMEFPMMANNDGPGTRVTIHEMMHTYFPMYVRTNEKRWAWMDEGWATYNEDVVYYRYFKEEPEPENLFTEYKSSMERTIGSIDDVPFIIQSNNMVNDNYYYVSYQGGASIYAMLHHHLGDTLFLKCYREYINRWAKKSPTPYDFFYTFENVSGQDLGWLWKPWFFEYGVPDLAIVSMKKNKLKIENKGQKPVPAFINILYNDSTEKTIRESVGIWAKGNKTAEINIPDYKKVKKITLNQAIVDNNMQDNFYPTIEQLYKMYNISEKIFGNYQFNVVCKFEKKGNLIHFKAEEYNFRLLVVPDGENILKSLDGSFKFIFQFNESGECTGINVKSYEKEFSVKKIE